MPELAKNQAKANEHPDIGLFVFEIILIFHPHYHLKVVGDIK